MDETERRDATLLWSLTEGAAMAWRYALSVQPAIDDVRAALHDRDWELCLEACALALREIVYCRQVGDGNAGQHNEAELDVRIALDGSETAVALRGVPPLAEASRETAERLAGVVEENGRALLVALPFQLPVTRSVGSFGPAVRVVASVDRLRKDHGLPPVDWTRESEAGEVG
jgi:hypothetical protein